MMMRLRALRLVVLVALVALLWAIPGRSQTGTAMPAAYQVFFNASGSVCANCKLYTYAAGTTTSLATYTTSTISGVGAVEHSNPIILNSNGRATSGPIFLLPRSYKFVLKTSADVEIWSADNISATPPFFVDLDVQGTAGEALTAGDAVFMSDGSGALTTGRWYRMDADNVYASSTAPLVGMVPASVASGSSGTVRLQGRVTGLSSLVAGTSYYASATAGAITATAPTNARQLGVADTTSTFVLSPLQTIGGGMFLGADLVLSANAVIRRNTADAADTGQLELAGGGTSGQSRGASFRAFGNEHATAPGRARAVIGTVSGGAFEVVDDTGAALQILGSTGAATLTSNVANAWTLNSTAGAGGNIRLQRSGTVKGTIGQTVSSGGADDMEVLANAQHLYLTSTSGEIRSLTLYNTTAADSANVFVQSDGTLGRSTSSARFKTEISPLSLTEARLVLGLQPVTFRSLLPRDDAARLFTGFTAEQAAAVSPSYATYGDGEPNGISDRAIIASLLRVIQDLDARIAALEAQ